MTTILSVAAGILVCLCLSAFCSSAEMSYSSCNTVRLENLTTARNAPGRR